MSADVYVIFLSRKASVHLIKNVVKNSFVSKMKAISQTQEIYSPDAHIADINLTSACICKHTIDVNFYQTGIDVRNTLQYTYKRKILMYKLFTSKLKMQKEFSPHECHNTTNQNSVFKNEL